MGRTSGISIVLVLLTLAACHPPWSSEKPARIARPEPKLPFDIGACPGEIGAGLQLGYEYEPGLEFPKDQAAFERDLDRQMRSAYTLAACAFGVRLTGRLSIRIVSRDTFKRVANRQEEMAYVMGARYWRSEDGSQNILLESWPRVDAIVKRFVHHEMAHAVLDHSSRAARLPMWLNEGIASYFERLERNDVELCYGDLNILHQLAGQGRIVPAEADWGSVEYGQSYALVLYIIREHGWEKLRELVDRIEGGADLNAASEAVLGARFAALQEGYAAWIDAQLKRRMQI